MNDEDTRQNDEQNTNEAYKYDQEQEKSNENEEEIELEPEDQITEELDAEETIKELKKKLKECREEAKHNLDGWQRTRADYANLQKQVENEKVKIRQRAIEEFVKEILPTLDNFEMAMKDTETWNKVDEKWRMGVEYIYTQLRKALFDHGIEEVADTDAKFNPAYHEPLETVDTTDPKQDDQILDIMQKGYVLDDRVIRTAKVKVYKYTENPSGEEQQETNEEGEDQA